MRWPKLRSFTSSFFLILRVKNYQHRSMVYWVIQKNKSGTLFETRNWTDISGHFWRSVHVLTCAPAVCMGRWRWRSVSSVRHAGSGRSVRRRHGAVWRRIQCRARRQVPAGPPRLPVRHLPPLGHRVQPTGQLERLSVRSAASATDRPTTRVRFPPTPAFLRFSGTGR